MTPEVFSIAITVTPEVIDNRNHVNNLVYLQWCMEAAEAHWAKNSTSNLRDQYMWYVLHHDVHYKAAALLGDKLQLNTWVSHNAGVRSERTFNITRPADNKVIVTAKTTWCLISVSNQKPSAITDEIRNLFLVAH